MVWAKMVFWERKILTGPFLWEEGTGLDSYRPVLFRQKTPAEMKRTISLRAACCERPPITSIAIGEYTLKDGFIGPPRLGGPWGADPD